MQRAAQGRYASLCRLWGGLSSRELRVALLEERVDAFAEVGRLRGLGLKLGLELELFLERVALGLREEALGQADAARRHRRALRRQLRGASWQGVGFDDLGDEAPGVGLRCGEL